MTFGGQVRLAGAVVVIVAFFTNTIALTFLGLCIMAVGATWQIDALEKRVAALEPKEDTNEEN